MEKEGKEGVLETVNVRLAFTQRRELPDLRGLKKLNAFGLTLQSRSERARYVLRNYF